MRSLAPLLAASLLVPLHAAAQELVLGLGSGMDYDNNVFGDESGERDDFVWRVDPRLRLEESTGDLAWGFRYEPTWEDYLEDEAPNGWNHVLRGDVEWQINDVTSLELSEFFARTTSVSRFNEISPVSVAPELEVGRERFKFNTLSLGLTREITPRSSVQVRARHFLRDYSEEFSRDIDTFGADASYFYTLSEADTVGAGFGYTRQTFEAIRNVDETSTDYYNLSGILRHRFSPTTILSLNAGPALVDSDREQPGDTVNVAVSPFLAGGPAVTDLGGATALVDADTCSRLDDGTPVLPLPQNGSVPRADTSGCTTVAATPPFAAAAPFAVAGGVPSVDDQNLTYFADASLVKSWENWSVTVGYRREASTSTGFGTDSIVDVVSAGSRWTPSSRWNVDFLAYWSRQTQASEGVLLATTLENRNVVELPGLRAAFPTGVRAIEVDDELRYDDYTGQVSVSYRLTKNLSLVGTFRYTKQEQEVGDLTSDFDRYRVIFLVSYEFDPIHL